MGREGGIERGREWAGREGGSGEGGREGGREGREGGVIGLLCYYTVKY